ncbi:MAG: hypothetical protein ABL888_07360 [Pirellulaceae bacterium]
MNKTSSIRCYDYVNHPFEQVRQVLTTRSNEVFHRATRSAETRAGNVAAGLHVTIAGIEIGKEILISVKVCPDSETNRKNELEIALEWKAATAPRLFPVMEAKLLVYPITTTETQLDFQGEYEPPMGMVGKALDAIVGRKIAEATVHHFVTEVADYLRKNIT